MNANIYILSDMGDATDSVEERSSVSMRWDNATSWRFVQGVPLGEGFPIIVADVETSGIIEDMPWSDGCGQLASDRLRRIIETAAPNHAQFLPVQLVRARKESGDDNYWVINWLHVIDCIDHERSDYQELETERRGKWLSINKLVIRVAQIPSDVMVCRVLHDPLTVLIRKELRSIFESAGVTGCQYYEVEQVTE